MALDTDKIDEAVLALLFLTLHDHWRAWKGFDWDALDRLYQKGLIDDPVNRAKSVVFTEEGLKRAEELFRAMFTKPDSLIPCRRPAALSDTPPTAVSGCRDASACPGVSGKPRSPAPRAAGDQRRD